MLITLEWQTTDSVLQYKAALYQRNYQKLYFVINNKSSGSLYQAKHEIKQESRV